MGTASRFNVELAIQSALVSWIKHDYPFDTTGVCVAITGNEKHYRAGGTSGITDLIIFAPPRGVLFLELKRKKGTMQDNQKEFASAICRHYSDWKCLTAYGYDEAKEIIVDFLSGL